MGKAFRTALPRTSPVCISFFLLALSYGVLMGTRGFSFLWPMCMSAFIFTGSMEFVTVNLLVSAFNPFVTFMLAVMLILTVPALVKGKLNRGQGILLLAIYAAFCAVQFTL